jgi:hypothetical protein
MPGQPQHKFVTHLLGLLDESWQGAPLPGWGPGWSYFADEGAGFKQSLAITAEQAAVVTGGTCIAQHVRHLTVGARIFDAWIRGIEPEENWNGSWESQTPDEVHWEALRYNLDAAISGLRSTIKAQADAGDMPTLSSFGAVAHLVYHLGAIRQKLKVLGE